MPVPGNFNSLRAPIGGKNIISVIIQYLLLSQGNQGFVINQEDSLFKQRYP